MFLAIFTVYKAEYLSPCFFLYMGHCAFGGRLLGRGLCVFLNKTGTASLRALWLRSIRHFPALYLTNTVFLNLVICQCEK